MEMYYNTTNETGNALKDSRRNAGKQDEVILEIFKTSSSKRFSPSQIALTGALNCPITSIRRSINTLTNKGYLRKTDIKFMGPYGKSEYCWEYLTK